MERWLNGITRLRRLLRWVLEQPLGAFAVSRRWLVVAVMLAALGHLVAAAPPRANWRRWRTVA
jgi:hypothetical protein